LVFVLLDFWPASQILAS